MSNTWSSGMEPGHASSACRPKRLEMERRAPRGEAPDADGHALADRDGRLAAQSMVPHSKRA